MADSEENKSSADNTEAETAEEGFFTAEDIAKMSPDEQREVAYNIEQTALMLNELTEEDLVKLQEMDWDKLQRPVTGNEELGEEDKQAFRELWDMVQDGTVTMGDVLGYSVKELNEIYNAGVGLCDQGRYDDSLKLAEGLIALSPALVPAHLLKAENLKKKNKVDEALESYGAAISSDPTLIQPYFQRAQLFFQVENTPGFLMDMQTVANLDPEQKTPFGKAAYQVLEAAESELRDRGYSDEEIASVGDVMDEAMDEIPADQVRKIDEDGNQILD